MPAEKQRPPVNQQLKAKQLELNSILEITQAINNNESAAELFHVYEVVLKNQLAIGKLAVLMKLEKWEMVAGYKTSEKVPEDIENTLLKYKLLEKLDNESGFLSGFDYIIPVYHKEQPLSFVLLGDLKKGKKGNIEDTLKFIQTITNIIIVAIENKKLFKRQLEREGLERELELAAKMQSMLVPQDHDLPNTGYARMAAVYLPHNEVGGDYYDYIPLNKDEFAFCIADISGKGVAAALLMANFQANLRAIVRRRISPDKFVHAFNKRVNQITQGDKFITLFVAKYNFTEKKLIYVNAGHLPPILYMGGKIHFLDKGCTILGIFEKLPSVEIGEISIEDKAFLFCYTDGLTELENEEKKHYGSERVIEFVKKNYQLSPEFFNKKLLDDLIEFKGKRLFNDDITILSCKLS